MSQTYSVRTSEVQLTFLLMLYFLSAKSSLSPTPPLLQPESVFLSLGPKIKNITIVH